MRSRLTIAAALLLFAACSASAAPALGAHVLAAPTESVRARAPGLGIAFDFGLPGFTQWPQIMLYGLVRDEGAADPFRHLTGARQFDPDTGQVLEIKPVRFGAVALVIDPDELDPRSGTVEASPFTAAVGLSDARLVLPGQMVRISPAASPDGPIELLTLPEGGTPQASAPPSAVEQVTIGPGPFLGERDDDLCPVLLMKLEFGPDESAVPPVPGSEPDAQSCLRLSPGPEDNAPERANPPAGSHGPAQDATAEILRN